VCAAAELTLTVYDIMGEQRSATTGDESNAFTPAEVIKKSRFLGMVALPLQDSVDAAIAGQPPRQRVLRLSRRAGRDNIPVDAQISVTLVWNMSVMGLLNQKERVLSNVLLQRQEILSFLDPLPVAATRAFVSSGPLPAAPPAEDAQETCVGGVEEPWVQIGSAAACTPRPSLRLHHTSLRADRSATRTTSRCGRPCASSA